MHHELVVELLKFIIHNIVNLAKIIKNIFNRFIPNSILISSLTTTVTIMIFLLIWKEDLFFKKFKEEIKYIPQSINQNVKEDVLINNMLAYSTECKNTGFFIYSRIEKSDADLMENQFKHIIGYHNMDVTPINLLGLKKSPSYKVFKKKYKISNNLKEILVTSQEGEVYTLTRQQIEDYSKTLEPLNILFKSLVDNYNTFKFIPVFHKKLGLVILIGYLEIKESANCSSIEIEAFLDTLYTAYVN